eukprot:1161524-Pelagomonas_calceolata.AAC.1
MQGTNQHRLKTSTTSRTRHETLILHWLSNGRHDFTCASTHSVHNCDMQMGVVVMQEGSIFMNAHATGAGALWNQVFFHLLSRNPCESHYTYNITPSLKSGVPIVNLKVGKANAMVLHHDLATPLFKIAQSLSDFATPLFDMAESPGDFATPLFKMAQSLSDFATPLFDMAESPGDFATPLFKMAQLMCEPCQILVHNHVWPASPHFP